MAERERLEKEKLERAKAGKKGGRVRVGVLTSGGNCRALNATMRGIARALYSLCNSMDIVGFQDGYHGLMYEDCRPLLRNDFPGVLTQGGTLLGTNRQPFRQITQPDEDGNNKVELMKATYHKLRLGCLCVFGGNGSQRATSLLRQEGLNTVFPPKTIDNDLFDTNETSGFRSAVEIASNAIDRIRTTAASHGRAFIVEVMGHKVGWLTLYASIAGGVDIILIPEIPYDIKAIIEALQRRQRAGDHFSIAITTGDAISKETAALSKRERETRFTSHRYPSVAYEIGAEIQAITGQEVRVAMPGRTQRSGAPDPYDRVLSSCFGARVAKLVSEGRFSEMVVIRNNEVTSIPFEESTGRLKAVGPDSSIIEEARFLGLSFGGRWDGLCRTLPEVETEKL